MLPLSAPPRATKDEVSTLAYLLDIHRYLTQLKAAGVTQTIEVALPIGTATFTIVDGIITDIT